MQLTRCNTPDTWRPETLAKHIAKHFDIHTNGETRFVKGSAKYKVTAWPSTKEDRNRVIDKMERIGYRTKVQRNRTTGNWQVTGRADVEDE